VGGKVIVSEFHEILMVKILFVMELIINLCAMPCEES
jgi:hypothetical protein